jgi:hypothetical protein
MTSSIEQRRREGSSGQRERRKVGGDGEAALRAELRMKTHAFLGRLSLCVSLPICDN